MPLSSKCKEIILGSVLGDGSLKLHSGYRNARFSFRHSITQKEYFYWKADQLSEVSSERNIFKQESGDGSFSSNDKLRFQSLALPELTDLFNLLHNQGRFIISHDWLNQLSELSLAMWWFDDGSIISNGRRGVLCTDGFNMPCNETLAHYLRDKWNVEVKIGVVNGKRKYYRLYFYSVDQLKKFLRIILPYVPVEEMIYKVVLLYKDAQLQQRWISEVTKLSGFEHSTIKNIVENKKSRWKKFRE